MAENYGVWNQFLIATSIALAGALVIAHEERRQERHHWMWYHQMKKRKIAEAIHESEHSETCIH